MVDKSRVPASVAPLPAELADAIEPVLPALTEEILAAIPREVPEYARPFEGAFGRGIRVGVSEALNRFVAMIRDPDAAHDAGEVYVGLGRGELRQGRSLDSLQAAYRTGARVAWRHTSAAAERAGMPPEAIYALADAIFAYIDEISAESVEGYAAEQSARQGEREARRARLLRGLARGAGESELARLAAEAGWDLPAAVAVLACAVEDATAVARRLPPGAIAGELGGTGCVVVADPAGPGARSALAAACAGRGPAVISAAVEPPELSTAWAEAVELRDAIVGGKLRASPATPERVEERLVDIALLAAADRLRRTVRARLAALDDETPASRARLIETLAAHLRHRGSATEAAADLGVHPQTVRYRVARLRGLLGSQLEDPDARFEIEAGLRAGVVS